MLHPKPFTVMTPDGLHIAAQEWGNPAGPEIVFIHGISQSSLSWVKQTGSDLVSKFRLITYDLRGHGSSDKPLEPHFYRSGPAWAGELKAIIDAAHLKRPTLVGWSYGGLIISDYVKSYGTDRLAAIAYVDSMIKMDAGARGEGTRWLGPMTSNDLATNIDATRHFLRACFAHQPVPEQFETMLAFNMMTPPAVRAAMVDREIDYDTVVRSIRIPVRVIHGAKDDLIPVTAARHTVATIPGARLSLYVNAGHSSFYEEAARFNTELTAFVLQK